MAEDEKTQAVEEAEKAEEFAKLHPVGFCKKPKNLDELPRLSAATGFMAPKRVDLRDYCTQTEDQLDKPWCAAFAAAGWAENIMWRRNDRFDQIDPTWIYRYAKQIDGDPHGDGTTLTAVMQALLDKGNGMFDKYRCPVKVIRNNGLALRYAIHKYGCVLGGFDISREWYNVSKERPFIENTAYEGGLGGHAVLICGYDREGVWLQNSWGWKWGEYGFARISWPCWNHQWIYGAVLDDCLAGFSLTTS